ncbi:MAG: hypothetical protein K6T61_09975 [Bryobacteraceae bacterium]|nr:hypothetical protein [Bryobacteraceae bacterium]
MWDDELRNHSAEGLERELDRLFAAYREACEPPEPSPNFMPRLWEKIEARRSVSYSFTRLSRALITAAAAICLLLVVLQATSRTTPVFYTQSYVEALAEASAADATSSFEISLYEVGGGDHYQ